jgi:hypothetical protein
VLTHASRPPASWQAGDVRQKMKLLIAFLVFAFASALFAAKAEIEAVTCSIKKVLPPQGWSIDDCVNTLVITGPKVRTLFLVSLPYMPDQKKLWREYARSERVKVIIRFQGRISDDDLRELKQLQARFQEAMDRVNQGIDHMGKDGDEHVCEFGFVRLPDFRTSSSSIFVSDNIAGRSEVPLIAVDPATIREVVHGIYQAIEVYCRKDAESPKRKEVPVSFPERKK